MGDEPKPRRASMDLVRGKPETNVMRSASSRDGLRGRFSPSSPGVAAASAFTSANAATLRAEVSAHRLNHQAMREVLREVSSLPPESSADADAEARRILRDAVALMTVGEKMVIDARRGASKSSGGSTPSRQDSGCLSLTPASELSAAARGLLRQYDPSGSGDPESFQDQARLAAAAYDAMVVRRAADKFRGALSPARRTRSLGTPRAANPPLSSALLRDETDEETPALVAVRADIAAAIASWDDFDAIAVDAKLRERRGDAGGGRPEAGDAGDPVSGVLAETALAAMDHLDLWVSVPQIDRGTVSAFLRHLEREYAAPDYHSAVHAADVTQAAAFVLAGAGGGLASRVEPRDAFLLLVAAAAHDVGHPGCNNAFLTATEDPAAVRWNDVSVNENGHLHALLRLTREHGVLDGFADEERRACRATLGRLVLSTDMAHHAKLLEDFVDAATGAMETASMNAAAIDENGNEEEEEASVASWSDPVLALCYVLHCADISNPARPWRLAREWGARVSEEFYKQGDRERALGVPVAALNDRYAAGATNAAATTAANQIAFARYVVEPTLEGLMTIAPGAVEVMLDRLRENTAKYARVVAGETVE